MILCRVTGNAIAVEKHHCYEGKIILVCQPIDPTGKDLVPSYLGHSIGHYEGDTLVIDTVGFNERAWMSRDALPSTDQLHTIERLTRPNLDTLKYEVTIDDPGAYTAAWTSGFTKTWSPTNELFEYVCQGNNFGPELMIGVEGGASRTSSIVP